MWIVCLGSARKLLHHEAGRLTSSSEQTYEDGHFEKSLPPAVADHSLRTGHVSLKEDLSLEDGELTDSVVNYTLASDFVALEKSPHEAVTGAGHDSVVDATADISTFPRKNDL